MKDNSGQISLSLFACATVFCCCQPLFCNIYIVPTKNVFYKVHTVTNFTTEIYSYFKILHKII